MASIFSSYPDQELITFGSATSISHYATNFWSFFLEISLIFKVLTIIFSSTKTTITVFVTFNLSWLQLHQPSSWPTNEKNKSLPGDTAEQIQAGTGRETVQKVNTLAEDAQPLITRPLILQMEMVRPRPHRNMTTCAVHRLFYSVGHGGQQKEGLCHTEVGRRVLYGHSLSNILLLLLCWAKVGFDGRERRRRCESGRWRGGRLAEDPAHFLVVFVYIGKENKENERERKRKYIFKKQGSGSGFA